MTMTTTVASSSVLEAAVRDAVARGLAEDTGSSMQDRVAGRDAGVDITSVCAIDESAAGRFVVRARARATVAGMACVMEAARSCGVSCDALVHDGDHVDAGQVVAHVAGAVRGILLAERTALNLLGLLSGTATTTRAHVDAVKAEGANAVICATRKTIPGLRALQKHAVRCGGGEPHRDGLFDAVMLKDNHLAGRSPAMVASCAQQVSREARARYAPAFVCCEVDSSLQLDALLVLPDGVIDIVLLDNFGIDQLADAVRRRDAARSRVLLEASGGVTCGTVGAIARTGVDRISVGALTHSVPWVDFGLDDA